MEIPDIYAAEGRFYLQDGDDLSWFDTRAEAEERRLEIACEQAERKTVAGIVAALLTENGRCDCFAKEEGECACGGWDDYKTWPLERVADWLSSGEWKQ